MSTIPSVPVRVGAELHRLDEDGDGDGDPGCDRDGHVRRGSGAEHLHPVAVDVPHRHGEREPRLAQPPISDQRPDGALERLTPQEAAPPTHRAPRGSRQRAPVHVDVVGTAESEPEPRDGRRVDAARPEHGEEHRPGRCGERRRLQPRLLERALHADGGAGRAASARDDHGNLGSPECGHHQRLERRERIRVERGLAIRGERDEGPAQDPEELPVLAQRPQRILAGRQRVEHGAEVVRVERSDEATHRSGRSCIGRATAGVFVAVRDEGPVGLDLLQTLRARPGPGAAIAGGVPAAADAGLSREARAGSWSAMHGSRGERI